PVLGERMRLGDALQPVSGLKLPSLVVALRARDGLRSPQPRGTQVLGSGVGNRFESEKSDGFARRRHRLFRDVGRFLCTLLNHFPQTFRISSQLLPPLANGIEVSVHTLDRQ